jgi:hypothetical protein
MLGKKRTLKEALKNLHSMQVGLDAFILGEGTDVAIFKELQHIIPTAGNYVGLGDSLDFEDPKVMSAYIHDILILEGALSACRKLEKHMEEDIDE